MAVQVVTIAGCNLPERLLAAYDIVVVPQYIVVDGSRHDTRPGIPLATVQRWIASASTHPHVVSGTVTEFARVFRAVAEKHREILVVTTSRLVIGSFDTATEAAKVVGARIPEVRIDVVDSNSLDLGSGLVALFAAIAVRERTAPVAAVEQFAAQGRTYAFTQTIDYLLLGGHGGGHAMFDKLLALNPILSFVGGQLKAVEQLRKSDRPEHHLLDRAVADLGKGRSVWCAIAHGRAPEAAARLADDVRNHFDVRFFLASELQSSIYLNLGDGGLCLYLFPVDTLDWAPNTVVG